jgi:hypothetical protein
MSINELLDSVNLNSKLSKWIIGTTITGLLTLSGINFFNKPKDNTELQNTVNELSIKVALLENKAQDNSTAIVKANNRIMAESKNSKNYIDSRLEFVVTNDNKGKDYILSVLNMSRELSVDRTYQVTTLSVDSINNNSIERIEPVKTLDSIKSIQPILVNRGGLVVPVVKHRSLIKRILGIL